MGRNRPMAHDVRRWSPKQAGVVKAIYDTTPGLATHVLSGGKRSGKSYCAVKPWVHQIARIYKNHDTGLLTASEGRREALLREMHSACSELGIPFHRGKRHVRWGNGIRTYYWIGKTEISHNEVEGHTWVGGIVDEGIKVHPRSLREMIVRCTPVSRFKGPIPVIITTNPSSPAHDIKTGLMADIEERRRAGTVHYFELADNPSLTEDELQQLIESYPEGPIRDREAYGKWVEISGAMFPGIDNYIRHAPIKEQPMRCTISVDPSVSGVWAAIAIGHYSRGRAHVIDEWYHDCRTKGVITPSEAVANVIELARRQPTYISRWLSDSADPSFGAALEAEVRDLRMGGSSDYSWPKPEIVASTRAVNAALGLKRLAIDPKASSLIDELRLAHWSDAHYEQSGTEKPDNRTPDHATDALRYAVWLEPNLWS